MRKSLKLLLIVLAVLLLLVLSLPLWVDHAAKVAVESGGSSAMGVATHLGKVRLGLFGGTCELTDLQIDNPAGYKTPFFLKLKEASVAVNLRSVMGSKVEMPTLTLDGLEVNLDRSGGGANYDVIVENLKKLESEPTDPDAKGKEFVIREVVIRNVRVRAQLSIAGIVKPTVPLVIDEIRLQNVGEEGVPLSKVFGIVIGGLLQGIVESGAGILPDEIAGPLGKGLGAVSKLGVTVVGKGGKTLIEGGAKAVEGIGKGIGNLFGGQKEK